ncbi:aquaporin-7 [Corythoichthys intestinalis]|uniref:aquaporin-7 n=1 Tax=Corythoichthys intestinalis TaxID=161448 RepID=UPI0025A4ED05|nr:aquaporin-7 [Corythoichthys intestinalis]XP_061814643.1 aquaporin-7-like [Nerophis lumbriciformis]
MRELVILQEEEMKDFAQSVEEGGSQRKGPLVTRSFRIRNEIVRVGLAECLCSYVMMVFGLGSVAQVVTGQGDFGHYISINLGFGLGVAIGAHVGGKVSGAHMNAAVSFAMCTFGRLAWKMFPFYLFSQLLGSFLAAGTVYAVYYEAIHDYCGGNLTATGEKATASIFATYPAPYLSLFGGFIDQLFGTAILLLCLMAFSDQKNKPAAAGSEPTLVGLLVLLIGISLGSNSGYAINPTRDFGPRLFTAIAGWGTDVFRAGNGWWWVPIVAPTIGGVLGAGLYMVLIELHHPPLSENCAGAGVTKELEKETASLEKQNFDTDLCV